MTLQDFGIDPTTVAETLTIAVDIRQLKTALSEILRLRQQVTDLQTRMSEMVAERQASACLRAEGCTCLLIQNEDPARHFKGCALRVEQGSIVP